jgi:hypothetical protein
MQTASRSVGGLHMNRARSQAGFDSDDDEDDADNMPPFEGVNQNIAKIGGVTLDRFLQSPTDVDDFDMPYHIRENQETSPTPPNLPPTELDPPVKVDGPLKMQCVAQLHHSCQRAFGKTDMLKFEFIEVDGPNSKYSMIAISLAILIRSLKLNVVFSLSHVRTEPGGRTKHLVYIHAKTRPSCKQLLSPSRWVQSIS